MIISIRYIHNITCQLQHIKYVLAPHRPFIDSFNQSSTKQYNELAYYSYNTVAIRNYVRPSAPVNPDTLDSDTRNQLVQFNSVFTINSIPVDQLDIRHARSSGAGGQNVNKVNTKVDMRFTVNTCTWLPDVIKSRMQLSHANKINSLNELIITSERYRTQHKNYNDCIEKLYDIIKSCSYIPTEPTSADIQRTHQTLKRADEKRIQYKKLQSQKKSNRKSNNWL